KVERWVGSITPPIAPRRVDMRWVRRWIGVAVIAAVLIGGWSLKAGNSSPVAIDFLFGEIHAELWKALLAAFAAGFALAGVGWLWAGWHARLTLRRYRKEVGGLEAEIHQLRNLPLAAGEPNDPRSGELSRAVRGG